MAKQIDELGVAAAITPATDLLWLEQAGLPKKLTIDALGTGMGVTPPKTDTATITTAGWKRIATNSNAAGRGAATIYISNNGGNAVPSPMMFRITKGYQATLIDASIDVITSGGHFSESVEQIRIIFDQVTNNEIHVEVFIQGGAGSDYKHEIVPDGSLGVWTSVDYTTGATADFALTWDLSTENVGRGSKDGDGHASWVNHEGFYEIAGRNVTSAAAGVVVDARGDAYLHLLSDRVSDSETNNPYILFSQDGAAVTAYMGTVGAVNLAPNQGVMTGMPNNGLAIVHQFATGSIGLGVNQRCSVLITDADRLTVQDPLAIGNNMDFWINGTEAAISSTGNLYLSPANGLAYVFRTGVDSKHRVYGDNGIGYIENTHDSSNGTISTNAGAINITPFTSTVNLNASALLQAPVSLSISNQRNVTTNAFDVDTQYRIGGTLTALHRWDSSLNLMQWMDRDPSTSVAMNLYLDTGNVDIKGTFKVGGDTVGHLSAVSGGFGSVECDGVQAGATWEGYNIAGRAVFMWNNATERGGIYDDVNNRWVFQWNAAGAGSNEQLGLYAGTTVAAITTLHTVADKLSGLDITDASGNLRSAGFASMVEVTFVANTTVVKEHWAQKALVHTNATTHTLTFNTLTTVPDGAVMWVKARTGIVTLVDGTMVLTWYNGLGGTLPVGNRTLAKGGWATIHKTGDSTADVTGVGIT